MKCPRDQTVLLEGFLASHPFHHCEICHGIFIGHSVVSTLSNQGSVTAPRQETKRLIRSFKEGTARCPVHEETMKVVEHDGVKIDLCSICKGLWLDHGELEKILRLKTKKSQSSKAETALNAATIGLDVVGGGIELVGAAGGAILEFAGDAVSSIFSF